VGRRGGRSGSFSGREQAYYEKTRRISPVRCEGKKRHAHEGMHLKEVNCGDKKEGKGLESLSLRGLNHRKRISKKKSLKGVKPKSFKSGPGGREDLSRAKNASWINQPLQRNLATPGATLKNCRTRRQNMNGVILCLSEKYHPITSGKKEPIKDRSSKYTHLF